MFLFSALSEYLSENETEYNVSDNTWKMSFTVKTPMDELEGEGIEAPMQAVDIVSRISVVEADSEDDKAPKEVYMSFQR